MERSLSRPKTQLSIDHSGKVNPRSKKIHLTQSNKRFIEDESKKVPLTQHTPNHLGKTTQIIKKKPQESQEKKLLLKDHTERKVPKNSKKPETEEVTGPRKRRQFKQTHPPQKLHEYVYIYDPHNEKMKKHIVIQGEEINNQLNRYEDYIPPDHTCDEDCDSSDEIVRKGVERSKRDLFAQIERRKKLQRTSQKPTPRAEFSDSGQETDDEKETLTSKKAH